MMNLACVFGASIICADLVVQQIPSKRNFKIQDSDVFLSASLSLSFGVMVSLLSSFHPKESRSCRLSVLFGIV